MTKDLTHGNPMGSILSFGVPLFFGCLFQQLYNVVDTAIVGKTLGGAALAAVGATSSINFLVVGFCTGVCSGLSIPVARAFGARQEQDLRRYVTGGTWLCVLFAVLLTVGTVLFCPAILRTMNTPEDIVARSYQYGALFYFPSPWSTSSVFSFRVWAFPPWPPSPDSWKWWPEGPPAFWSPILDSPPPVLPPLQPGFLQVSF